MTGAVVDVHPEGGGLGLVTVVTDACPLCGEQGVVRHVSLLDVERWERGAFIQAALPTTSADEREQMMTGMVEAEILRRMAS